MDNKSNWSQADRDEHARNGGYFAGPDQSFPLKTCADVRDAWNLAGHAANPDRVRRNIKRWAKKHGCTGSLPDTAKEEDDGKASSQTRQLKTLIEHYNEEMAEDLLEDWQDVYVCALTGAILDAFTIGDKPESDVAEALDAFKELVLSKFVAQAQECDLSGYLEEHSFSSNYGAEYTMQYGSESKPNYGYMSRRGRLRRKDMYANDVIKTGQEHIDTLHATADKAMKKVVTHTDSVRDAADTVLDLIEAGEDQKSGRSFSAANKATLQAHADSLLTLADSHTKAMNRAMKAVHTAADDLATILQGSEGAYGTDRGTPEDGQEGKGTSYQRTRAARSRSSFEDTVTEEDVKAALSRLQAIKV